MGAQLPLIGEDGRLESLEIMQAFYAYLAPKPYCTDTLGFLLIRPKPIAIRNAYIQPNPITRAYWLVFDIDSERSRYWPEEWAIPTPNIEIRNPENNHQHLLYMIDPAVYTLRQARRKPLELAADVDRCLTALLGADPGYGKLLAKNPFSRRWTVYVWHENAWGLTELLDRIPDRLKKRKAPVRETIGLGRNCAVFDAARVFAYSEWRRLKYADYERLFERVYEYAMNVNVDFTVPMLPKEVKCIVRSVSKWTARHMDKAGDRAWHQRQNAKSVKVRRCRSEERAIEIRTYCASHPDVTREELARIFDVGETVIKGLSLGLAGSRQEAWQSQAAKRAGEIRVYKAEHPSLSNRAIAMVFGVSHQTVNNALR
jgi:hypothetical protein